MNQTDYYWSHLPRCIAGFTATPATLPGDEPDGHAQAPSFDIPGVEISGPGYIHTTFMLSCTCGHDRHYVLGYYMRIPELNDALFLFSPITLRCAACGKETGLFDVHTHGYDSELEHITTVASPEGELSAYHCDTCGTQPFQVYVRFEYTDDLFDVSFKEFEGRQQDLFSWISVYGECAGCSRVMPITDFECA